MHIENGRLVGARYVKAHASGGAMTPRYLVVHDTAGQSRKYSSVEWFASSACKTSAHFVVERDGTITQMVDTNKRAYHAGVSHWKGVSGLNSCSVGIEIVNPGKLDENGNAWFGHACEVDQIKKKSSPNHGAGYWLPYTDAQIKAVVAICRAVVEEYPDCNEIVTHYEIAPKRKIDVNPLFPLEEVRRSVFDPKPGEVELFPEVAPPKSEPATPVVPSRPVSAAQSKTVWAMLSSAVLWVVSKVDAALSWLASILGDVQTEVEGTISPIQSLGALIGANLKVILPTLAIGLTAVAIARHVRDRNRVKELEAKAGEA